MILKTIINIMISILNYHIFKIKRVARVLLILKNNQKGMNFSRTIATILMKIHG